MSVSIESHIQSVKDLVAELERRDSGPKPPRGEYSPSGSEAIRTAVGDIVLNWGTIVLQFEFHMSFLRAGIDVPEDLRPPKPANNRSWPEKDMLRWLKKLSRHRYQGQGVRPNAAEEYAAILREVGPLKDHRDRIVHATVLLSDVPDTLKLHYRGEERVYSLAELQKIARNIAEACDALLNFEGWARHEQTVADLKSHIEELTEMQRIEQSPLPPHT